MGGRNWSEPEPALFVIVSARPGHEITVPAASPRGVPPVLGRGSRDSVGAPDTAERLMTVGDLAIVRRPGNSR